METLPNGMRVFNATPHPITFWKEGWPEPVSIPVDQVISATPIERVVETRQIGDGEAIAFVRVEFIGTDEGRKIAEDAFAEADVIVGSIIAAQAYPGLVVAMTPAPGYERRPPNEKRMNPDKFTVFS